MNPTINYFLLLAGVVAGSITTINVVPSTLGAESSWQIKVNTGTTPVTDIEEIMVVWDARIPMLKFEEYTCGRNLICLNLPGPVNWIIVRGSGLSTPIIEIVIP